MPPEKIPYADARAEIQSLLDFSPPVPPAYHSVSVGKAPFLPFPEQHLARELSLKAIRILPTLENDIRGVFDKILNEADVQKPDMPFISRASGFPRIFDLGFYECDAKSIAKSYMFTTGYMAPGLASIFSLHQNAPSWSRVLEWENKEAEYSLTSGAFNEDFTMTFSVDDIDKVPQTIWDSMTPENAKLLRSAASRNRKLCMLHSFAPTPKIERVLDDIDTLASIKCFPNIGPSTKGYSEAMPDLETSPDALRTPWGADTADLTSAGLRRSVRVRKRARSLEQRESIKSEAQTKSDQPSGPHIVVPSSRDAPAPGRKLSATPASVIQHAWYRAVEIDATFLILHSGKSQRLGFRHRKSQTLYLTPKIIPYAHDIPSNYSKLHVGFFICVLRDALERERQIIAKNTTDASRHLLKPLDRRLLDRRARPRISPYPRTRNSVKLQVLKQTRYQTFLQESRNKSLLLLRFHEGLFQSTLPASFVRLGEVSMAGQEASPTDCMVATLTSRITSGATGDVHYAKFSLLDQQHIQCDLIVKLAYEPHQRGRLRHEAEVYEHLEAFGVQGIPTIFGMFRDVETRTLAMVMQYVGESIAHQIHRGIRSTGVFSADESASFIKILDGIHKAGVRHRDLRPLNLMVDEEDRPFIIDFDRALQGASESSRQKESEHFHGLLTGTHEDELSQFFTLSRQKTPPLPMSDP